jgi:Lon protease-like protein
MSAASRPASFPIPPVVPVMLLGESHLFPHTLMPLYIFEPRYRAMLRYALEKDRLWVIASPVGDDTDEVHPVAGLGLIRACVHNADGTSHMVLQGVQRIRIRGWELQESFRLARVEPFQCVPCESEKLEQLGARLLSCVARHKAAGGQLPGDFEQQLSSILSPEIVADIVSAALVSDPGLRQALLSQPDVAKRIERLIRWFE